MAQPSIDRIGVRVDPMPNGKFVVSLAVPVGRVNVDNVIIAVTISPPSKVAGSGNDYPAEDVLQAKALAVGSALTLASFLAPSVLAKLNAIRKTNELLNRATQGDKEAQDVIKEGHEDLQVGLAFYRPELEALGGGE